MSEIFTMRIIYFDSYLLKITDDDRYIDSYRRDKLTRCDVVKIKYFSKDVFNEFMERSVEYIPIVRLFGTTLRGQKCCLNIHNYFPYFYVEINKDNFFDVTDRRKLRQFAEILEKIYLNYTNSKKAKNFEKSSSEKLMTQIIHNIEAVEKFRIYGFSKRKMKFLKIFVYDPKAIKILMKILHSCVICGRFFQCYEAHISYSMHFFADNELYGMGLINVGDFSFRYNIPEKVDVDKTVIFKNISWEDASIEFEENSEYNFETNNEKLQIYDYHNLRNSIQFNNLK
jgi:DNA polymerase elongation subunit (family B)